jgi:LmbE family N-acetylglucosaminyl deacetylase
MDKKTVAIIVAHPDDETLWADGTILEHPEWQCYIVSLCRKGDPDRAPKFVKTLKDMALYLRVGCRRAGCCQKV